MFGAEIATSIRAETYASVGAGREARGRALEVYYAQRDFHQAHGRWAKSLEELALSEANGALSLAFSENGYTCRADFTHADGVPAGWVIYHDRHLLLEYKND